MPDAIAVPPSAAPPGQTASPDQQAPAQQAEGNTSVLDYARRKLRQSREERAKREVTGPKAAKGQSASVAQRQPTTPGTGPVTASVLSQAATDTAEAQTQTPEVVPETPEAPESTSEEPRPEGTEGESEQDLPEDAPDWYKKRIARFTRQKGDLERKAAELEADRNAIRAEFERQKAAGPAEPPLPVVVNQSDPASQFVNEPQLDQAMNQARQLKRWCELNPEGGILQIPNSKGGYDQREFSAEQVQTMRFAAEDDLEQHLPRRREHLRQEQAITSQAVREHPWLTDKNSPRVATFRKIIEADPSIRLRPDWARVTAIFVRGLEVVDAESKAASTPSTPKPKTGTPPPKLPGPSATAPPKKGPIAAGQAELSAAEKEWRDAPSQRTFARLQAMKKQLRESS